MVRRKHRLLSLVLTLFMVLSLATVAATASVSAAAGDTVYCQNDANWGEVYCYMWNGDGADCNASWPGVKMTKGNGNLWSYTLTGDWTNIIFNGGQNQPQTGDLTHQGNGGCYNNQTGTWSVVDDAPINPNPQPTTPTPTPTPTPGGSNVVYCKNDANWGKVNVYMWTDGAGDNASWPGVAATNIGDGVWMLEYTGDYNMIIFNDGSTQTSNLNHPGTGQMYNNSTGQWSLYDPSQLHIKSVTADPTSPQYTGVDIKLSIVAGGGEGELMYKFTANSTVISDYSADSTVTWTPTTAGTYTITYSVKDEAGNTKEQTASFKINDITTEVKPVVQTVAVTPTNSDSNELQKGKEATIDITAGGGNTGTKLLFYKVKITDPNGKTANVPYYTLKDQYKFTPTTLGTYEIAVSVQGSDNSTVTRTYEYECVDELSAPGELKATVSTSGKQEIGSTVTVTASATGGVAPYTYQFTLNGQVVKAYSTSNTYALSLTEAGTYAVSVSVKDSEGTVATKSKTITVSDDEPVTGPTDPTDPTGPNSGGDTTNKYKKGDSDCNGSVNVKDATAVQKHIADMAYLSDQGVINGEVDGNNNLNVKDATMIQKYVAGMDVNW